MRSIRAHFLLVCICSFLWGLNSDVRAWKPPVPGGDSPGDRPKGGGQETLGTAKPIQGNPISSVPPATPCVGGTAKHRDAEATLKALGKRVRGLALDADPSTVFAAVKGFTGHDCFAFLPPSFLLLDKVDSASSLKHFWESGAEAWFDSALHLVPAGRRGRRYWVLPGIRQTLTLESRSADPRRPLLCSVHEPTCGKVGRGWQLRAEDFFKRFAKNKKADLAGASEWKEARVQNGHASCEKIVADDKGAVSFSDWADCVEQTTPRVATLPLGQLKVPTEGWMIIRGRRGHHRFCDEVRAYHLGTGSAYIAQDCGGLVLRSGGSVDHQATNAGRRVQVKVGHLPLENLREAAWMALMVKEVSEPIVEYGMGIAIPEHVVVQGSFRGLGIGGWGFSGSSNQTRLYWTVEQKGRLLGHGELTWPEDYNAPGPQHAVSLLQVAEAVFVEGCAPLAVPATLFKPRRAGGVSGLDARPADLERGQRALWKALMEVGSSRTCKPKGE